MATMDDILGVPPGGETAPKGTLQWTMQQGGSSTQAGTETSPVASVSPSSTAPAEEARQKEVAPDGGLKPEAVSDGEVASTLQVQGKNEADGINLPEYHGKVMGEYGDIAIMEDGTIRRNGIAGPVYITPKSYEQQFRLINFANREEEEKQRKKEKRDKLFAAIGDGVRALSNLFFTTRGAPNMYDANNSMSQKTKERYEKMTKDRDEKRNAYIVGIQKAREADQRREQAEREWQRVLGLDARNEERYREEAEHKRNREKIADDRYAAELEYKKQRDAADDDKWNKTYEEGRRRANQSHALAVQAQKDGSKYYGSFDGKGYKTKADYDEAVMRMAKEMGIPLFQVIKTKGKDKYGLDSDQNETRQKSISQLAAEIESKRKVAKKQRVSPTAGNQGKKKSPTA